MFDDASRFFARSNYHKPDVLRRIANDLSLLCNMYHLSCRVSPWGGTQQLKLCVYGGLPISVRCCVEAAEQTKNDGGKSKFVLPVQIWLTQQFPIDPPSIFIHCNEPGCKVLSNHKYVDVTGRCHTPELAGWRPTSSSLVSVISGLKELLEEENISPLCVDRNFLNVLALEQRASLVASQDVDAECLSQTGGENAQCVICFGPKDTVLVPCGHYCLCVSCASNLSQCPVCREVTKFRQRVYN
ncbi:UEV domain/Zinc finger, C3HC4 type (RING finger), putative [Trypanosoma equiperdum]|uniref:UEV domain-containing protein n=2 Tax=Trypanozoon TaxID=39700 RepID=Q382M1_TRYB2|nr:hypothetical protein, conserved [Trypanosoma brucei brucei TREU927]EAN80260.1 hypothetical protein, conserved [Trypanosoma brucei brucei TREU927]SCU65516.1 UEV domain/Zinc finger, C3HC4 type (RING finger), putative [Trypanosoma equiperdum]